MKNVILAGAVVAALASPAFAQSYSPGYGSGNIAPSVTAANPGGQFRYNGNIGSSSAAAYAQAPTNEEMTRPVHHRRHVNN
jgi:hypothetical protein